MSWVVRFRHIEPLSKWKSFTKSKQIIFFLVKIPLKAEGRGKLVNELQILDQREVLGQDFRAYGDAENPLFKADDVATWIEHSNVSAMIANIDDEEKQLLQVGTLSNSYSAWFLTEDGLYEVLMQSRKPIAKEFKKHVKEILKQIRKTGSYTKPMTQIELLAGLAQETMKLERRTAAVETKLDSALDVLAAPPDKDWRHEVNGRIRGMCQEYGLSFPRFYDEIYTELEQSAHVNIKNRLDKLRARMIAGGATKTQANQTAKLDVVERDPKLKTIFDGIVKKRQAKYTIKRFELIDGAIHTGA
jgi:prophage antirepressor-like protein